MDIVQKIEALNRLKDEAFVESDIKYLSALCPFHSEVVTTLPLEGRSEAIIYALLEFATEEEIVAFREKTLPSSEASPNFEIISNDASLKSNDKNIEGSNAPIEADQKTDDIKDSEENSEQLPTSVKTDELENTEQPDTASHEQLDEVHEAIEGLASGVEDDAEKKSTHSRRKKSTP